jgi:hypothetical protein
MNSMDQLIDTLSELLRQAGDAEELVEPAAIAAWNHVAGEALRQQAVPVRVVEKTLIVAVADAIWQKQLASMSSQLLYRLNSLLGQGVVTYIEFRVDPESVRLVREQRSPVRDRVSSDQRASEPIPFELASAAASIRDPDLRRAFMGAAMSCDRRLKAGKI